MSKRSGMYSSVKRKKELARKKKQEEKRMKRQKEITDPAINPESADSRNNDPGSSDELRTPSDD